MRGSRVCVVGLGSIGLPTAVALAQAGYSVVGVDHSPEVLTAIESGAALGWEPGLAGALHTALGNGSLQTTTRPVEADRYLVCVPTGLTFPEGENPQPDIPLVFAAIESIAPVMPADAEIIVESTVPVGTTELLDSHLKERTTKPFHMAHCPERVLPGKVLEELINNDRVVGGITPEAASRISAFFRSFVRGEVVETDSRTAEFVKLAENTFRDVNIAYANQLSLICQKAGLDVFEVIRLANRHPRVEILQPGCGVGGHCVTVNPWYLTALDPSACPLLKSARGMNDGKPDFVFDEVIARAQELQRTLGRKPVIVCLGLAFKTKVGDLRISPAYGIYQRLQAAGWSPLAVEPYAQSLPDSVTSVSFEEGCARADLLVGLVPHPQFAEAPAGKLMDFCGIGHVPRS